MYCTRQAIQIESQAQGRVWAQHSYPPDPDTGPAPDEFSKATEVSTWETGTSKWLVYIHWKSSMEHKKGGLEDDVPF